MNRIVNWDIDGINTNRLLWGGFLIIVLAGVFFRLYQLDYAAMRGDTMIYWNAQIPGGVPFSMEVTKHFLQAFNLMDSVYWRRFPSAVWGILIIPAAFGLGRIFGGKRSGMLLAALMAWNPYLIQCAREAYFYAPLTLGTFLEIWASVRIIQHVQGHRRLQIGDHLVNATGFFLMCYVHPPGWPTAFLLCVLNSALTAWYAWDKKKADGNELAVWLTYLIIGLPFVFSSWGPLALIKNSFGPARTYGHSLWDSTGSDWQMLVNAATHLAWGITLPRLIFTGIVLLSGLIMCLKNLRRDSLYWILPLMLVLGTAFQILARKITISAYETRYLLPVYPIYSVILMLGLANLGKLMTRKAQAGNIITGIAIFIALGLYIQPAWTATRLTGLPKPYKDIVRWVDNHFDPGTLVLVDRWFEPWNELRIHPSTNVYFTFTIPSEPVENYLQYNWRQTVKDFVRKYPQAAYLEIQKTYWTRPAVGPWHWAEQYFHQHVAFTNEAAIKLRDWGLASREGFDDPFASGIIVDLYYDTRADILDRARQHNEKQIVLYGPEWKYIKLWQQYRDFRDWRILENKATLDVYNLTLQTNAVTFLIHGMAANGSKRVRFGTFGQTDFQNLQLAEWRIEHVPLKPGLNPIVLSDELWSLAKIPLLVDQVEILDDGRQTTDTGR